LRVGSPDEQMVAIGESDGTVTVLETTHWAVVFSTRLSGPIEHLAFSSSEQLLSVVTKDGYISVLAIAASEEASFTIPLHARRTTFSPDGDVVAFGTQVGETCLLSLLTRRWVCLPGNGAVLSLAYSPDGQTLVMATADGSLSFVDTRKLTFGN